VRTRLLFCGWNLISRVVDFKALSDSRHPTRKYQQCQELSNDGR
jgi:hypothetical protein